MMAVKKTKIYERTFIVNQRLQIGVLLYTLVVAVFVSIANQAYRFLEITEGAQQLGMNYFTLFVGATFLVCLFLIWYGLHFTNQIAGPIFRLQRHLENIKEKRDVPAFSLRKGDYFHEITADYNSVIDELKSLRQQK